MQRHPPSTICLAMIVRDEAHIIARCLESVRPFVSHWVICDTGSVDDTCVRSRAAMAGIPGQVYHHHWEDFGHNRTRALQLARASGCDYILVIDADEVLAVEDQSVLVDLTADSYRIEMRFPDIRYPSVRLLRSGCDWSYRGTIHEYPVSQVPATEVVLDSSKIYLWTDGMGARGRSGTKGAGDLAVLEKAVVDEPLNPRYWFYLAQSYEMCGRVDDAILAYSKRTLMGDYLEEVWYSHYRMAQLCMTRDDWRSAVMHYLDAFSCLPSRAEPLYHMARGYHNRQLDQVALMFLEQAVVIPKPISALFVEAAIYDYLRWVDYASVLWNTGEHEAACEIAEKVLASGKTPDNYLPVLRAIVEAVTPREVNEVPA